MYRAWRAEHPGTAAPRRQVRHGHTHTTEPDGPRAPPAGQRGQEPERPGCCGAEVEHRPTKSRSGAGGAEDQKAPVLGCGEQLPPGPGTPSPGTAPLPPAEPKRACSSLGSAPRPGEVASEAEEGCEGEPQPSPPTTTSRTWGSGSTCRGLGVGGQRKVQGFAESRLRNQLESHGRELRAGLGRARHWGGAPSPAEAQPPGGRLLRGSQEQPRLPGPTRWHRAAGGCGVQARPWDWERVYLASPRPTAAASQADPHPPSARLGSTRASPSLPEIATPQRAWPHVSSPSEAPAGPLPTPDPRR